MNKIIKWQFDKEKGRHFITPESRELIDTLKLNPIDITFEYITEKRGRSLEQLRYYWSVMLKVIAENIDGLEGFVDIDDSGKHNYQRLHRYLTMKYCIENERMDLCTIYRTMLDGKWIDVPICHLAIDKMTEEEARKYFNWLDLRFYNKTGFNIGQFIEKQKREVQ